jgi:hypothetical protein
MLFPLNNPPTFQLPPPFHRALLNDSIRGVSIGRDAGPANLPGLAFYRACQARLGGASKWEPSVRGERVAARAIWHFAADKPLSQAPCETE